ncbi:MAG: hypothetical protein IH784_06610, partial [Bacteroidetes bacterium]|nr:hypothetical protein [Bacteroidota bacterium]
YLQKSHTWINVGLGVWLAFIAVLATWIIEGEGSFDATTILIGAVGTAFIGAFSFSFYWASRKQRFNVIEKIKKLKLRREENKEYVLMGKLMRKLRGRISAVIVADKVGFNKRK